MRAALLSVAAGCLALALSASAKRPDDARPGIETLVARLAGDLSAVCRVADPADQTALDACRRALFTGSLLRQSLADILLWGRPNTKPGESLKNTRLTQFAPEAWTGLYAPLFMFDGSWRLDYREGEQLYEARFGALFRNGLDPGQYPYPFWHDARKWNDYQSANTLILWIAPQSGRIVAGQFANDSHGANSLKSAPVARPPFDGQWMWTDATGIDQPAPTLFRGLFSRDNPYVAALEPAYREFADAMRMGHCNACHVPDNPSRMNRLVLLQTPAHAASEIKRIMRAVRDNQMPVDDSLLYHDIDSDTRIALLDYGGVFEDLVDAARAWEAEHTR